MTDVLSVPELRAFKERGEKIASLTAYDATFARVLEAAGVEVLLVGDSLGVVVQGHLTTVPVGLEDMVYHTRCVSRVVRRPLVVADLPFASYAEPMQALRSAARLLQEGGAQMVKLEGGRQRMEVMRLLVREGIPVCGHLGLLPQSIHRLGRYRVQGREAQSAQHLIEDACLLEEAGAELLVLECVPATLAETVTAEVTIPTIGIGAGSGCDGQVLVLHDMLGMTPDKPPRFVQDFLPGAGSIEAAVTAYVTAVKAGRFPGPQHVYR
ncbi:3-methyl-2-oxobutanoate hydroxymethyltransferase [Methylohalobius crimeensis]|uniref:3-methyl-2-oxobutanoate hydroxymethyltransferase n=1 Tax=Methylohalobius crimeensis TaxID=244365 RepID=UPI0003B59EE3|nr:3-methyl-2-oxobutanoate hydroxymethyltransferase [Methylohalobius crimeensis]